ncbi:AhpC-TSA-domain-containing protein [Polyporus arcularius HHB13444]|uniref:thioredoxin-dependent peroxiredoxin n=1 Tax=Polyporus arcularius HHB13444 TaxID=1314778 RepID=A0A5C3P1D2_9APHY|nr:AhpC-TSA-domain-containing protein [Polyporus arcularius HHB13444]
MAPRAKASTETAEPARRSSRISAQPAKVVEAVKETVKKATAPRTKKRSADADEGDGGESAPAVKKVTAPALEPINIGDTLPSYIVKNEKDEDVDVATLAAEKGVILFLVPKADTPGCTQQACGFRDIYPDFASLNFDVYCLSADKPAAQSKWQTKKNLPYPLLSDPQRVLITALGAGEGGKTKRSHFIFEKGGKLVDKKIPVKPVDSPKLALEFVKSLAPSAAEA